MTIHHISGAKYRPDQARAPAGSREGGRWTSEGGSHEPSGKLKKRTMAIYGETSGLYPKLLSPNKSPYDQSNWDIQSAQMLHTTRTYIGIVSERNPKVHYASPIKPNNPIQASAWRLSEAAAREGGNQQLLNPKITHFFLRQDGVGLQRPPWQGYQRYLSLGPFLNIGGGDVPRGGNTYVDFYGK